MSIFHRRVRIKPQNQSKPWMKELEVEEMGSEFGDSSKAVDLKTRLNNFVASQGFSISMAVITIYTIFAIDVEKACFDEEASVYFSLVHCLAIALFVGEIVLLAYSKEGYLGGFYFWIDCFSTLTMFLEIIWIEDLMSSSQDVTVAISFAKVTKASRLSKIGARSSKIMKLIRLVRLMKFLDNEQPPEQPQDEQSAEASINADLQLPADGAKSSPQGLQAEREFPFRNGCNIEETDDRFNFHESGSVSHPLGGNRTEKEILKFQSMKNTDNGGPCFKEEIIRRRDDANELSEQSDGIEDLMAIFFQQNMNKFIEEGKNISGTNLEQKRSVRNSSKLSVLKKKEATDLSRVRKAESSRHSPATVSFEQNEAPFGNILEKLDRALYLPAIERDNVDPAKQEAVEQRYKELMEREREESRPKRVISSENLKVGEVLKEEIQKNIVVMVMGLIMVIPIITADTWFDQDSSLSVTANLFFHDYERLDAAAKDGLVEAFIAVGLRMSTPLVSFHIPVNDTCCHFPEQYPHYLQNYSDYVALERLRLSEQVVVIDGSLKLIFSKRANSQVTAYLNLGRSAFITLLLIFCSVLFMKDIEQFALNPLEKMSSLINKISNNPFEALKQINEEKNSKEDQIEENQVLTKVEDAEEKKLETNILSDVIIKITTLLTIGAGEIGSEIISENIEGLSQEGHQRQTDANANKIISTGNLQTAVYVNLQFRSFDLVCDAFGDKIFPYINLVTSIVHSRTIQFAGIPIEFDGRGFLLLWKSPAPTKDKGALSQMSCKSQDDEMLSKMALLAIHSVTKIITEINSLHQTRSLFQFLQQKHSSEMKGKDALFVENYEPHLLNASVHVGDSYYGSMGSSYKLECKCFGYEVSYTRFLCDIIHSEKIGVSNLISESLYLQLADHAEILSRLNIRKIDQLEISEVRSSCTNNGAEDPKKNYENIYTFDFLGKLESMGGNSSHLLATNGLGLKGSNDLIGPLEGQKHSNGLLIASAYSLKQDSVRENSVGSENQEEEGRSLKIYREREKWLEVCKKETLFSLLKKLENSDPEIRQNRKTFDEQFYESWNDAVEFYLDRDWQESLNEFKFLHTYNPFFDYPSKRYISRIENSDLKKILEEEPDSDGSQGDLNCGKKKWEGYHEITWAM